MNSDNNTALQDYLLAHIDAEPGNLRALERDANLCLMNPRMCSGHLQGRLLCMLVRLTGARRVLELGTFGGYAALSLAEGLPDAAGAEVVTVEHDDEKEDFIRRHLGKSPHGTRVSLVIADALEYMSGQPDGSFDMIFLDSDKRTYADCYAECKRLLVPGGLLLADNVLWDGHIVDERYDRDRQTAGVRRFNDMVAADRDVNVVILPLRDGLSLIRKK